MAQTQRASIGELNETDKKILKLEAGIQELEEKNKQLEENMKQRHRSIVQLTQQVQQLQSTEQQQGNASELKSIIADLEEKLKHMKFQNEKLLEKNQSDVYEWKNKEKSFHDQLIQMQTQISSLQKNLSEAESKIPLNDPSQEQNILSRQHKTEVEGHLVDINNLQNQLQSYQQLLAQESNVNRALKDELQSQKVELTKQSKKQQDSDLEIQQLRDQKIDYQNQFLSQTLNNDAMKNQFESQKSQLEKFQSDDVKNNDRLFTLKQQLNQSNQLIDREKQTSNSLQQKLTIIENELKDKSNRLKQNQDEYKSEMLKLLEINTKSGEKFKDYSNEQQIKQKQTDNELNLLKKDQQEHMDSCEQDKNLSSILLQSIQKQNKEYKKTLLDQDYKFKDLNKQLDDKSKQYIKQLELQKGSEGELKQTLIKFRQVQEQLIQKEEDLQRSKLVKNKLLNDNLEFKNKQELQQSQITKLKSTVVQDLKKQLEEKEQEIILIKEVVKSTKIMLRVKDNDLGRLKQRCKQLDLDNINLMDKYQHLEGIFQDIMQTTKNKKSLSPQLLKNSKVLSNSSSVGGQAKHYNQLALLGRKDILSSQDYTSNESHEFGSAKNLQSEDFDDKGSRKSFTITDPEKSFKKPAQVIRRNKPQAQTRNLKSIQETQNDLNESIHKVDYNFKDQTLSSVMIKTPKSEHENLKESDYKQDVKSSKYLTEQTEFSGSPYFNQNKIENHKNQDSIVQNTPQEQKEEHQKTIKQNHQENKPHEDQPFDGGHDKNILDENQDQNHDDDEKIKQNNNQDEQNHIEKDLNENHLDEEQIAKNKDNNNNDRDNHDEDNHDQQLQEEDVQKNELRKKGTLEHYDKDLASEKSLGIIFA